MLFLGRSDELERFDSVLYQTFGGEVGGLSWPHVVLVHGLGGIGKTSLLAEFRARIAEDPRWAVVRLDWESERRDEPARFGGDNGPSLPSVLDVIQREALRTFTEHGDGREADRAFSGYRSSIVSLVGLERRLRAAAIKAESDEDGATDAELTAMGQAALAIAAVFTGQPAQAVAAATAAAQGLASNPGRWRRLLGGSTVPADQYQLMAEPARYLSGQVGLALAKLSEFRPVVVMLDTSEIVLNQMRWLREAMSVSGGRVLWVVAARLESHADAGEASEVTGFIRQVPSDRLRLMALTRFDDRLVREYLHTRLPTLCLDDEQAGLVASFTRGLPLAVSLVAGLLAEGVSVDVACAEVVGNGDRKYPVQPGEVVEELARRFLIHAETAAAGSAARRDLDRILALAICYSDPAADPGLLHVLWDTDEDLSDALHGLARRHDFVLSGSYRLHDDVQRALRADLLAPLRRERIQPAACRARDYLAARLAEQRVARTDLEQQLTSATFVPTLLELIWFTCWDQPEEGLTAGLSIAPILSILDWSAASTLRSILSHFFPAGDQRDLIDLLLIPRWYYSPRERSAVIRMLLSDDSGDEFMLQVTSQRPRSRHDADMMDALRNLEYVPDLLGSSRDNALALEILRLRAEAYKSPEPAKEVISTHSKGTSRPLRRVLIGDALTIWWSSFTSPVQSPQREAGPGALYLSAAERSLEEFLKGSGFDAVAELEMRYSSLPSQTGLWTWDSASTVEVVDEPDDSLVDRFRGLMRSAGPVTVLHGESPLVKWELTDLDLLVVDLALSQEGPSRRAEDGLRVARQGKKGKPPPRS